MQPSGIVILRLAQMEVIAVVLLMNDRDQNGLVVDAHIDSTDAGQNGRGGDQALRDLPSAGGVDPTKPKMDILVLGVKDHREANHGVLGPLIPVAVHANVAAERLDLFDLQRIEVNLGELHEKNLLRRGPASVPNSPASSLVTGTFIIISLFS